MLDERLKQIDVIIALFSLQGHGQAFQAHARVDVGGGKWHQTAIRLAVELHEHQVPNLDDLWMVLVYKRSSGNV